MSAANIILQANRAIVWTDGSQYDDEGRLISIVRKCHLVAGTAMVVTGRGNAWFPQFIVRALEKMRMTIDDVERGGATLFEALMDSVSQYLDMASRRDNDVFVAGWSEEESRAKLAVFTTVPPEGQPRFKMAPLDETYIAPQLSDAGYLRLRSTMQMSGMSRETFDWMRLGIPLMEAQRLEKGSARFAAADQYLVGGHILETIVTAAGVTQKIIHEWPEDKVGERIRPTAPIDFAASPNVTPIIGMNRAERRRLEKQRRAVA